MNLISIRLIHGGLSKVSRVSEGYLKKISRATAELSDVTSIARQFGCALLFRLVPVETCRRVSSSCLSSIYVGVLMAQVRRRRNIPAGARRASGLTQILRQLRPGFHRDSRFPSRRQIDRRDNR